MKEYDKFSCIKPRAIEEGMTNDKGSTNHNAQSIEHLVIVSSITHGVH
jgi:hypothetical protein